MTVLQLVINGVLLGGAYLLLALGLNLIFGVLRIVNFAHGGMLVFAGLFVYWLSQSAHVAAVLAVVIAVVSVAVLGAITYLVALSRIKVEGYDAELLSLLLTYGVSLVLTNASTKAFTANYVSMPSLQGAWNIGSIRFGQAATVAAAVGFACGLALMYWLRGTRNGKQVLATAHSQIGAEVCGINARATKLAAFTVGATLAGLAGALLIFQQAIAPTADLSYTVLAFVMIAIGGLGSFLGASIGAMAVALLVTFVSFYWSGTASSLAPYALLLAVMLVRAGRSTSLV